MKQQQRNPYGKTKRRKAALAWLAAHGITQPRPLYPEPTLRVSDLVNVKVGPLTSTGNVLDMRKARLV